MGDLKARVTTEWTAQNVYRVVYNPDTLRVDGEATERARAAEREARKQRGRPYAEFEREWSQKRPADEIIKRYGSWPNP
jgi:acetophenone carboxylase